MQRTYRWYLFILLMTVSLAAGKTKEDWGQVKRLAAGTQVRVTTAGVDVDGLVRTVSDVSLVVSQGSGEKTLPRNEVKRVVANKVSSRTKSTLLGVAIGGAIGLAGGGILAAAAQKPSIIYVGVLGSVWGGALGSKLAGKNWREIYLRP